MSTAKTKPACIFTFFRCERTPYISANAIPLYSIHARLQLPTASLCDCAHPPAWHLLETAAFAQTDICRIEPGDNWEMRARMGNVYSAPGGNSQDESPQWTASAWKRQPHASAITRLFLFFLLSGQIVSGHSGAFHESCRRERRLFSSRCLGASVKTQYHAI